MLPTISQMGFKGSCSSGGNLMGRPEVIEFHSHTAHPRIRG